MIIRDGDWSLFDYDPQTGRQVWVMEDGDRQLFRIDYPVGGMVEENKTWRNMAESNWKGDYHRVASIPLNLLHDENTGLNKAWLQGDENHFKKWLNDPDNRAWRTKEGKV